MDVGKAIRFVFEDELWVSKILLGAVISLVPIFGGIALVGYGIAVVRNVSQGLLRPLPSWDRIGEFFVDGLLFTVALLVYSLPLLILTCPIALVWLLPVAAADTGDLPAILASIAGLFSAGVGCLAFLYALFLWVLYPVIQIRYAETGKLAACLQFGEVFRFLLAHLGQLVVAQLVVLVAGFIVTTALSIGIGVFGIVPLCGWVIATLLGLVFLPIGVWLTVFGGHLYGQIRRHPEAEAVGLQGTR